jgi:hypothetical protein
MLHLRLIIISGIDDVPINSENLDDGNFVNLKISQSHLSEVLIEVVCVHVFMGCVLVRILAPSFVLWFKKIEWETK